MIEDIARTPHSTGNDARRLIQLASETSTTVSDQLLLEALRQGAKVSVRRMRGGLVEVSTASAVLGYVQQDRDDCVALRGDDPAWAEEIGRYPSESLAVEALRMRRA